MTSRRLVDLSHSIRADGTTFQVDRVVMMGSTGTSRDSPFHRYAEGDDLASLPLASLADLPTVVVAAHDHRAVTPELLEQRSPASR